MKRVFAYTKERKPLNSNPRMIKVLAGDGTAEVIKGYYQPNGFNYWFTMGAVQIDPFAWEVLEDEQD